MSRRRSREIAMQVLFQVDVGGAAAKEALAYTLQEFPVKEETALFAKELVEGTLANQERIDRILAEHTIDWELPRMGNVDRNILRVGLYELLYTPETPVNVAIDEALELAKSYSHDDAPRFINGVLGQIAKEITAPEG